MLVAEFLASDEAENLSDREAASRCADHIVEYGCDQDFGRPLRMSPAKAETFLLDWLPRKVMLSPAAQHAMPHVLAAWVRWAGVREGRDAEAIGATLDAVFDSMGTFTRVYHDPASFGLEPKLVARLLPDSDLEALARRVFAFGDPAGQLPGHRPGRARPGPAGGPPDPAGRRPRHPGRARGRRRAHRPAPGAGRPAVARRPAGAVGGRAAPARPRRGPARGAAHADGHHQVGGTQREGHRRPRSTTSPRRSPGGRPGTREDRPEDPPGGPAG